MKTWIQLSPQKAHTHYRVPLEMAMNEENLFFGTQAQPESNIFDMDGPWPFLAFLRNGQQPGFVTFQVCTLLPEALEFELFDPLTDTAGYLILSESELTDLVEILLDYSRRLPSPEINVGEMFQELDRSQLAHFHFHPELFPRTAHFYYRQIRDPLREAEQKDVVAFIVLGKERKSFSVRIARFLQQALEDTAFNPLDNSIAQIHLDQNGLQEFASLLLALI